MIIWMRRPFTPPSSLTLLEIGFGGFGDLRKGGNGAAQRGGGSDLDRLVGRAGVVFAADCACAGSRRASKMRCQGVQLDSENGASVFLCFSASLGALRSSSNTNERSFVC
jgi:hypothetical protein